MKPRTKSEIEKESVKLRRRITESEASDAERYRRLVEFSPDGIVVHCEGKIVFANSTALKFAGATEPEQLIGKTVLSFVHPDFRDSVKKRIGQMMEGKEAPLFEEKFIRLDGTAIDVEVVAIPFTWENKPAVQVIFRDISEWKHTQEMLQKSERKYRLISERTSDLIAITTFGLEPTYLYVSPSVKTLLGYEPEEPIGESVFKFVHPDDMKKLLPLFKKYFNQKAKIFLTGRDAEISETIEYRVIDKSGNWHYFQSTVNFIGKDLLFISRDITERLSAEKAGKLAESQMIAVLESLRESEEQYRGIFESAGDTFLIFNSEAEIVEANPAACKMYGYPHEELIGLSGKHIVHPDYYHIFEDFKRQVKATGFFHAESVDIRKDGSTFNIEVHGAPYNYRRKQHLLAVVRDITERKQAEKELKQKTDQLVSSGEKIKNLYAKSEKARKSLLSILQDVTEKEKALRESEGRFRDVANNTGDWIWEVDVAGRYTYSSPVIKQILGYDDKEVLGKHFYDLFHPDERDELKNAVFELFKQKKPLKDFINRNVDKNGRDVILETNSVPLLDKSNNLVGYRGVDRDITERKRVEEELQKSETHYRAVVKDQTELICRYLADETLTFVNDAFCRYFGKKYEELIGHSFMPLIQVEDREIVRKKFFSLSSENPIVTYEYRVLLPDNKTHWLQWIDRAIYDQQGNLVEYQSVGRDITELKQMVEELKSAHEYARNLIDSSLDMIIAVDKERRIVEFNKAAEETFGYDKAEVLGKHIDILYADPAEGLKTHNITRTTGRFSAEIMNKRKNGGLFSAFLSASVLRDASGEFLGIMGVSRDITKVKQAEKEKEALQDQLFQSQKVEAIGKLASGIAHDFNNILTIILGHSQLASDRLDEDNPIRKDLEKIKGAGERAAILTRQLLIFSRKQVLEPKILDLNVLVTDVEKMLGRLLGEDIELITVLESKLTQVKADRGQIEQVLINLVFNARDAMPDGGRISIQTQNVTIDKDVHKIIPESVPGKFVQLTVEDTGIGIDEEILSHIFEPFFSTKKSGEGTGLGLSVVYDIVKQHNGWINVYSEPGRGSTFKFYLPAILAEPEEEIKEAVSIETLKGSGERILLVEDELDVRQFAVTVLREYGYIVFDVGSVKEAQRVFEDEECNFDLVFSDVVLPDQTGLQLVDDLLVQKPAIRVLLSSGYSDHKSQWSEIKKSRFRFLQKPYTVTDLLNSIKEVIQEEVS